MSGGDSGSSPERCIFTIPCAFGLEILVHSCVPRHVVQLRSCQAEIRIEHPSRIRAAGHAHLRIRQTMPTSRTNRMQICKKMLLHTFLPAATPAAGALKAHLGATDPGLRPDMTISHQLLTARTPLFMIKYKIVTFKCIR